MVKIEYVNAAEGELGTFFQLDTEVKEVEEFVSSIEELACNSWIKPILTKTIVGNRVLIRGVIVINDNEKDRFRDDIENILRRFK